MKNETYIDTIIVQLFAKETFIIKSALIQRILYGIDIKYKDIRARMWMPNFLFVLFCLFVFSFVCLFVRLIFVCLFE